LKKAGRSDKKREASVWLTSLDLYLVILFGYLRLRIKRLAVANSKIVAGSGTIVTETISA
jgi:hypothetical protein